MTKTDFIRTLDFEAAKASIAKKLGVKTDELVIKASKSGDFKIDLRKVSGKLGKLFSSAGRAMIVTDKVNIRENKESFSYSANIMLNLKNGASEYSSKIGKIDTDNNKFNFHTIDDMRRTRLMRAARNESNAAAKDATV